MSRLFLLLAMLAMPACAVRDAAPVTAAPTPSPQLKPPGADVLLKAERAFAAAEIEWQSAIAVGRVLVARGAIRGATAAMVREWNGRARGVIVRGKAVADAAGKSRAAADLLGLAGQLDALTGRK